MKEPCCGSLLGVVCTCESLVSLLLGMRHGCAFGII